MSLCDFPAAILKGVIEHGTGTYYFGSLLSYDDYAIIAIERGWLDNCLRVTDAGLDHYVESGLADLPTHKSRAYRW